VLLAVRRKRGARGVGHRVDFQMQNGPGSRLPGPFILVAGDRYAPGESVSVVEIELLIAALGSFAFSGT